MPRNSPAAELFDLSSMEHERDWDSSAFRTLNVSGTWMKVKLSKSNSQNQCFRNKKQLEQKNRKNEIGVRALTVY